MKRVAIILGVLLALWAGTAEAQTKVDEFGRVGHCDVGARLDNVAIQFQAARDSTLQIVVYGPPGEKYGSGKQMLEYLTDYLVNSRGIDPEKIKQVYGGRNSDLHEPRIQLWLVPEDAVAPEPEKFENNLTTFKGMFAERELYEDFGVYYEYEGMGPGIGNTSHASFADMLTQQKNTVGYIVVYNTEDSLPGSWRRSADTELEFFKEYNVDPGRFKIIYGGKQKESKIQLWLLPKDAPPPVADAGRESFPKTATLAGDLDGYYLKTEEFEARSFKILSDVLRTDKNTRAFVAVWLDAPPPPESEATEQEAKPAPREPEPDPDSGPADLTKIVEKWRTELTATHKIRNDRFIVIFLPGTESNSNSIRVWFVPKGAALPDPNKVEEEVVTDKEEDLDPPKKP